jgi:hypothetical protein
MDTPRAARAVIAVSAALLAGCATGSGAPPAASEPSLAAPRRCSPADPERGAWYCVLGQLLYTTAGALQPESELRR